MQRLTDKNITVHHMKAEDFVANDMPDTDLIIIDPQRRTQNKRGLFQFEDCSPDIIKLLPLIKDKAKRIMVKTSPVLDITAGIKALQYVEEVHVVEWQNECKELVFILNPQRTIKTSRITASAIDKNGETLYTQTFTQDKENETALITSAPQTYLFEPSAAFQKAGGYKILAADFDTPKLAQHTHLYTATQDRPDFPGRRFKILGQYPVNAKTLPIRKANLTIRNFPMAINTLKKKLKITDGGTDTLFACTLADGTHCLLYARRV